MLMLGKTLESLIRKTRDLYQRANPAQRDLDSWNCRNVMGDLSSVVGTSVGINNRINSTASRRKSMPAISQLVPFVGRLELHWVLVSGRIVRKAPVGQLPKQGSSSSLLLDGWTWKRYKDRLPCGKKVHMKVMIFASLPEQYLRIRSP